MSPSTVSLRVPIERYRRYPGQSDRNRRLIPRYVDTPALLQRGNESPLRIEPRLRPTGTAQRRPGALLLDAYTLRLGPAWHCRISGALGGTRTPTILLTATSRQRVYQFRHERLKEIGTGLAPDRINGADVTNRGWRDKACRRRVSGTAEGRLKSDQRRRFSGCPAISATFA